uniref:Tyrosine-protein kinase receptor n=1 Tax=Knipowitschia caucasica TaxID=637954 RepID=A0AAV2JEN9_KNICA
MRVCDGAAVLMLLGVPGWWWSHGRTAAPWWAGFGDFTAAEAAETSSPTRMIQRPKPTDSEVDLLREQQKFLSSGAQAAASVLRRPDKRPQGGAPEGSQEAGGSQRDVVSIEDLPDEVPSLTPAPPKKSRFKSHRVTFEPEDAEERLDREDTHISAVLSRIIEKDTSSVPVLLPEFTGLAFPKVLHRSQHCEVPDASGPGRKRSIFARQITAQRIKEGKAPLYDPTSQPQTTSNSAMDCGIDTDQTGMAGSRLISGQGLGVRGGSEETVRIHLENQERLQSMSQSVILDEQKKLLSQLDPRLVQFVKSRTAHSVPPSATAPHPPEDQSTLPDVDVEMEPEQQPEAEPPLKPHKDWVHMDKVEPEKLEWMRDLPPPRKKGTNKAMQARFDFVGTVIPPTQDLPTHLGLHHHGEEPERAGYSLQELFLLSRSQMMQQRTLALSTLANIISKARCGAYRSGLQGSVLSSLLDAGLLFLLRFSLDDSVESVMCAALHALHALLVRAPDEACIDNTFSWFNGMSTFPLLPLPEEDDEDEDEPLKEAKEKGDEKSDYETARQDVVKGLLKMKLLPRMRYILEVVRPSPHVIQEIMGIIIRLARHSTPSATQVLECPRLIEVVVRDFLPPSWSTPTSAPPQSAYGVPQSCALKLLRVLSTAGRHLCARILNSFGMKERLACLLSAEPGDLLLEEAEAIRISTEAYRMWAVAARYGQACDLYIDLYPALIKSLQCSGPLLPSERLLPERLQRLQALVCLLTQITHTAGCHQELQAAMLSSGDEECLPPPPVCWEHVSGLQQTLVSHLKGFVKGLDDEAQREISLTLIPAYLVYLQAYYHQLSRQKSFSPVQTLEELEKLSSELTLLLSHRAVQGLFKNLKSLSVVCNALKDHSDTTASLPALSCPREQDSPSPLPLLTGLALLLDTVTTIHKGLAPKFTALLSEPVLEYISGAAQATPPMSLSTAWLLRHEHLLLYLLLRLANKMFPFDPEFAKRTPLFHQMALVLLSWLLPGFEFLAHELLSNIIFTKSFIPESHSGGPEAVELEELRLQEEGPSCNKAIGPLLRAACAQLPSIRACFLTQLAHLEPAVVASRNSLLGQTPWITSQFLPELNGPALPSDWPYLPLVSLYERAGVCGGGGLSVQELPPGALMAATHCLQWLLMLEVWREKALKVIPPVAKLARLSCVFLCSSDLFLERPIQSHTWALFQLLTRASRLNSLDLSIPPPGQASFQDLYSALLAQYEAVSFGNPLFGCWMLLPLQRRYSVALRLAVFGEHVGMLRSLGVTMGQLSLPLENFTSPPEDCLALLRLYFRCLLTGVLKQRWCPVLYVVALSHLNSFMFSQQAAAQEVEAARVSMLRKTFYLTDEVLKKHLLLFRLPQSDCGFELYEQLPPIRTRRLEQVVGPQESCHRALSERLRNTECEVSSTLTLNADSEYDNKPLQEEEERCSFIILILILGISISEREERVEREETEEPLLPQRFIHVDAQKVDTAMEHLPGWAALLFGAFAIVTKSSQALDHLLEQSFYNPLDSDLSYFSSCDFESTCLWTFSNHSKKSDWAVVSADQTASRPHADHSQGSSKGHFLELRPSPGQCEYFLTSPVLPFSSELCSLRVALSDGALMAGNLSLSISPVHSGRSPTPLLIHSDSSRGQWEELEAVVGRMDQPFLVTLSYVSCEAAGSTVALDSLEFQNCEDQPLSELNGACGESFHCDATGDCVEPSRVCDFHTDCAFGEDEGFICGALPLGSYCSFELDECGWSVSTLRSHWRRVSADNLEPKEHQGEALLSTPGHFLFLQVRESGAAREASVISPQFPAPVSSTDCQMYFSLYLYGDFNGTLVVAIEEIETANSPLVWERNGPWTDDWDHVVLQLTGIEHRFQIKVSALWAPGSEADVALDFISLGAACFYTDVNELGPVADLGDLLSPLPEPSDSEVPVLTWFFNSCGASGPHGPTQTQCDTTYRNKNVNVTVGKDGALKGVQMWRVPATNRYRITAYGAAGGKGAKNHNKRSHGVIISAMFALEKGDTLYILVGHQGEDACPGRNQKTQRICLGESSVIEDNLSGGADAELAGGGGGGGGATYIFKMVGADMVPLLVAAGGGGNAYLEDPESSADQVPLEQFENSTSAPSSSGRTGAAGGGGGWSGGLSPYPQAGQSLVDGAMGGSACPSALSILNWATYGGFGGGGGACTAGGGGGGYRGGDAAVTDKILADGQAGISFIHPTGQMFLQPLAVMESHGECEIKVQPNCSRCQTQDCRQDEETREIVCFCHDGEVIAQDNVTCISVGAAPQKPVPHSPVPQSHMSVSLILAVVASTVACGIALICAGVILMWYRRKSDLHAVRGRLQSPEYNLSKIRSSTIMTDYNPNYCFAGKITSLCELQEVPRKNITLLKALGHGAFGEVYEGQLLGMSADNSPMQVAIKTLPEICSEQDEMDFLMEALIMSKFSHENIVRCIGVSLNILPRFILLELMTGGDMKSFLRQHRPRSGHTSCLTMTELLRMARDIACGCRYLEENHFIHRDIAARNCLLTCEGPERVAKIGDFGMARDIYRASYYRKGGRAMLPVKWMPPEAFMEGIFTCKTDTWSFGVLLWEILSLGYMPYPCKTNQEVLEFVTSGGRMDPPKGCPGPVYRIMTQCWQHCPEHRPNFSTILERINYCTQDPDVIHTPLPVEYGPAQEEDAVTRPSVHPSSSLTPLLSVTPASTQFTKPQVLHHTGQLLHHEAIEVPPRGAWPQPETQIQPHSGNNAASGSQRLKNKSKNLWNPTYGSWVLGSFRGKKALAHTQSMPLSTISCPPHTCSSEGTDTTCDGASSLHVGTSTVLAHRLPEGASSSSKGGMGLAKLESFPCGNVNYAYDGQSSESENRPLAKAGAPEARTSSSLTVSLGSGLGLGLQSAATAPKLFLKRHASYGHEDVRRHTKADKPPRDRDSGFSLSEDLSVNPI